MNTTTVANLLGVSQSTLKRWIKELDLDMNRNELGHFDFNDEDIFVLKHIQKQIQKGTFLQDVVVSRNKVRNGKTKTFIKDPSTEALFQRMSDLEKKLNEKADKVVSYQLLTHRKEIEDLENEVKRLHARIELLEGRLADTNTNEGPDSQARSFKIGEKPRLKKRNLLSMLFNF